jgi:starvation-inducible DNA-binding protein
LAGSLFNVNSLADTALVLPPCRLARGRQAKKEITMSKKMKVSPGPDFGISEKDRAEIVQGLSALLADTYTLYLKTHNYHWNVTGPMFRTLHLMFMELYTEQWAAVDMVAERIRALGAPAPGTYEEFAALTSIVNTKGLPNAMDMVKELMEGQATVVRTARTMFTVAEKANDQPTCDLLTQRMQIHEKNAWMLRSLLEE